MTSLLLRIKLKIIRLYLMCSSNIRSRGQILIGSNFVEHMLIKYLMLTRSIWSWRKIKKIKWQPSVCWSRWSFKRERCTIMWILRLRRVHYAVVYYKLIIWRDSQRLFFIFIWMRILLIRVESIQRVQILTLT